MRTAAGLRFSYSVIEALYPGHFIQRASALLIRTTDPCRKATGEQRASALLISILASGEQRASALSILTASLSPQLYVQRTPALLIKAAILKNLQELQAQRNEFRIKT